METQEQPAAPTMAKTARQRAREEITAEILTAARTRLTRSGPGELSLRAVARDVGMVSSAVYRYFSSRDDLLTALLVLAYDEIGESIQAADELVTDRHDVLARWMAACRAIRTWALAHPGDYALLYGSPVPGYVAPPETVGPATRGTLVLVSIVMDAHRDGSRTIDPPRSSSGDLEQVLGDGIEFIREHGLPDASAEVAARTIMAWTSIFGTVSFELFGHLVGSVHDTTAWFDEVMLRLAADLDLT